MALHTGSIHIGPGLFLLFCCYLNIQIYLCDYLLFISLIICIYSLEQILQVGHFIHHLDCCIYMMCFCNKDLIVAACNNGTIL